MALENDCHTASLMRHFDIVGCYICYIGKYLKVTNIGGYSHWRAPKPKYWWGSPGGVYASADDDGSDAVSQAARVLQPDA